MNQTYTVKAGDTLYGISNQYGVSVTDILSINNVNPNNLQIGEEIIIPNKEGNNPNDTFVYAVKKGDTLYGIAIRYNTTVSKIKALNNLNSNTLSIGQRLVIPETYAVQNELPSFSNYTVKKGDTLYSVARNNNVDINVLIKDNSLNSDKLSIGQVLKIRKENVSAIEECYGADYDEEIDKEETIYTVKKGDTLYSIAKQFNTTTSALINNNNLSTSVLSIGQELKIPTSNNVVTQTYIVKKGDNLYSIAQKYNTTVDSIKRKNNLTSNLLSIGQQLII